jgi:hypothetical protein
MKPRRILIGSLAVAVLFFLGMIQPACAVNVGDPAPDFELDSTAGGKLKLSSLRGKTVLLNFYILDFSPG